MSAKFREIKSYTRVCTVIKYLATYVTGKWFHVRQTFVFLNILALKYSKKNITSTNGVTISINIPE